MLIELQDVEAHINPTEVVQQALENHDIYADELISLCIDYESADYVLESLDTDDIKQYCIDKDINLDEMYFEQISEAVKLFTTEEKAKLLWLLLKCEEV